MDPIRLIDQADLTDRERAALQAGREQPVVYDVSRGAERLGKALRPGASAAVTASSVAAKLGIKLLITAALAALAFIASLQMTTHHEDQRGAASAPLQPIVATPAPAPAPSAQPAAPQPQPEAPIIAVTDEHEPAAKRAPRKQKAVPTAVHEAPALRLNEAPEPLEEAQPIPTEPREPDEAAPEQAPAPSAAMLEMKAIARAKRALSERDPDKALAILADIARDFPRGYFIEERRALRVLALAEDGESEQARREGASFVRDYPSGAFTARVKAAAKR